MAVRMGILQRHPGIQTEVEVEGELAYFGLASWWSALFTKSERNHIEEAFQPPGLGTHARPLTTGHKQLSFRTAAGLLTALAADLRNETLDRTLALRVLAKAEERAKTEEDILGLHLTYQEMIRVHCRWRDRYPESLDLLFGVCHKQIAIAPEAAKAFGAQHPQQALPIHAGFQMMAILLEKEESYGRAIEICKQARFQGWSGSWTWRIGCLAKKLSARGDPVPSMSPSGLGPI